MTKTSYSDEYKAQVLKRAEEIGVSKAAKEFGIPTRSLYRWRTEVKKEQGMENNDTATTDEPVKYNDELIKRVLMRVEEIGEKRAAFEFSVPLEIVEDWVAKVNAEAKEPVTEKTVSEPEEEKIEVMKAKRNSKYSDEFKQKVLARADEIDARSAADEFNVPLNTIKYWKRKEKIEKEETAHKTVVKSTETPVPEPLPVIKAKKAPTRKTDKKSDYTEELKNKVLARVSEIGVKAAADEFNVPWQAVTQWKKKAKETHENPVEIIEVPVTPSISDSADENTKAKKERPKERKTSERPKQPVRYRNWFLQPILPFPIGWGNLFFDFSRAWLNYMFDMMSPGTRNGNRK